MSTPKTQVEQIQSELEKSRILELSIEDQLKKLPALILEKETCLEEASTQLALTKENLEDKTAALKYKIAKKTDADGKAVYSNEDMRKSALKRALKEDIEIMKRKETEEYQHKKYNLKKRELGFLYNTQKNARILGKLFGRCKE